MDEEKDLKKLYNKFDDEYYSIIEKIIDHPEFQKRLEYHHHENRSVYTHSLTVSYYAYKISKFLKLDYESTAIAGLLHDFYYDDWQTNPKKGLKNLHGFVHAQEALDNSNIYFSNLLNDKISDSILRHMFPLTIKPPKYLEGWIITLVDKYTSLEIFKYPKQLYKYVGLALIFKKIK